MKIFVTIRNNGTLVVLTGAALGWLHEPTAHGAIVGFVITVVGLLIIFSL